MPIKIGVIMDPIENIKVQKDSTFAMLLEAQRRGWEIHYMEQSDLFLLNGDAYGNTRILTLRDDDKNWFAYEPVIQRPLTDIDVLLMRKDPPFDIEFINTTYLLERAEESGVLVVNKPQSLRDANEKMFTAWFSQCCPPTLIARTRKQIEDFLLSYPDSVIKPLDSMGGQSIFRLSMQDDNRRVIIDSVTQMEQRFVMVQKYISEITEGDKRILLINGEPVPYALARIPPADDFRGNLAVGGRGEGRPLTERDRWICNQIAPVLRAKSLDFVGIDVIGDYLTEVNVTSPTGIRELDKEFDLNICAQLMDHIETRLSV